MRMKTQIIAIGGGGFATEENALIDRYVLTQARAKRPAVAFIPTASGDADALIARYYATFLQLKCKPSHLPFFKRTPDLRQYLLKQDVIYVGGGNTKSMLAIWDDWGLPHILREAWEKGVVLAGTSAGSICWFDQGITDSWADELRALDCMGFLAGSCCPHYDGEAQRRPTYHRLIRKARVMPGYALDDCAAAHFIGERLHRVVASKPGSRAYRVWSDGRSVKEERLPAQLLR